MTTDVTNADLHQFNLTLATSYIRDLIARQEELEAEQVALHERMAASGYYKTAPNSIVRDTARTDELVEEISKTYDRWEELEALRDA